MTGIIPPRLALRMTIVRGITVLNPPVTAGIGLPYSHTFRFFGGTGTITSEMLSALPDGWSYDAPTHTLSNPSPDTSGSFEITLYAHDAAWDNELTATFTVNVVALPLTITNSFSNYTAGVAQSFDFTTAGGTVGAKTFAVTSGALPPGLSLSSAGHISGNTTGLSVGAHSYTFGVTATDLASTASPEMVQTVTVTVVAISITNSATSGTAGSAYTFAYIKSGGTGTVTWSKQFGALPPGLSLSSAGVLSGTPSAGGIYSYIVAVTDNAGTVATRSESVAFAYPTLTLTGTLVNIYDKGDAGSTSGSLAITGGSGVYSNARVIAGALPTGCTLSISGSMLVLSGTTTAYGSFTSTVAVDSSDGQTATMSVTVIVGDPYFSSVVSGLHMDGLNGSTTFADIKSRAWSASGGAQISTAQSMFGGSSGSFGSSGQIQTPQTSNLEFGSNDFTLELWIRPSAVSSVQALIANWHGVSANFCAYILYLTSSGKLQLSYGVGATNAGTPTTAGITAGAWTHVVAQRRGNVVEYYINGVKDATTYALTGSLNSFAGESTRMGWANGLGYYAGYFDDVRITNGVARYLANFTPPSRPFQNGGV